MSPDLDRTAMLNYLDTSRLTLLHGIAESNNSLEAISLNAVKLVVIEGLLEGIRNGVFNKAPTTHD
jgi:hypothetical protein